jgi:hypothetical protein
MTGPCLSDRRPAAAARAAASVLMGAPVGTVHCRRCGAPLPALGVLVSIAHEADADLAALPTVAPGLRTRAAVRVLASLLPCFAGACVQFPPRGRVEVAAEGNP